MQQDPDNFEPDFEEIKITIQRYFGGEQIIFKIFFSDNRTLLVISCLAHERSGRFWTSIPENRQKEGEQLGLLILKYYVSIHISTGRKQTPHNKLTSFKTMILNILARFKQRILTKQFRNPNEIKILFQKLSVMQYNSRNPLSFFYLIKEGRPRV